MSDRPIVGVLGGGQLGRMLALAGLPLGLRFRFLDPAPDAPAREVGEHVCAEFGDTAALARFADGLTLATYEFENVPAETVDALVRLMNGRVDPSAAALRTMQDRLEEKRLFQRIGLAVPEYAAVATLDELRSAGARLRTDDAVQPLVLKSRRMGYDGKGQAVIREVGEGALAGAWTEAAGGCVAAEMIVERFVRFERELSLVAARGRDGAMACYPLVENHHAGGMLRLTVAPAPALDPALQAAAEAYARSIMDTLGYVGVMAIEFFQCRAPDGRPILLGNEMAPRVHNSGHWTMDGAECSQFENHLRALVGWPLGPARPRTGTVSAMLNIIGTLPTPPDTARLLAQPDVRLHLYGKSPRTGRKLGHVNVSANTHLQLRERIDQLRPLISAACGDAEAW